MTRRRLTDEQEILLIKALDSGIFGRVNLIVGLGLVSLGLAREIPNNPNGEGWDAHLCLTEAGAIFADLIKRKRQAQISRARNLSGKLRWRARQLLLRFTLERYLAERDSEPCNFALVRGAQVCNLYADLIEKKYLRTEDDESS